MQPFHLTATGYNINDLPEYIALRHGFFAEQGLDVTVNILNPWDDVLTALDDGSADMALSGIWVPFMYRGRVQDYTVFAQIANRCPLALIRRRSSEAFKLSDVVEKTVLMKSGGGASVGLFCKMLLREIGIDPRAVDYVQDLQGQMSGELFEGGMGDFFVTDNLSALAMKGIDWVMEHDAESFQDELAELFPAVPIEVAIGVTNGFRRNNMWTTTSVAQGGYERWQVGLAGARSVKEPLAYATLVNDGPASAAQKEVASEAENFDRAQL
ncbi:hypothetical protein TI39_contig340g00008 [Zymoseptoria brevis]|uniref:4-amino-5-hydroxymethyl-2-methylpyrimidine phosphate synthase n=1 Tax=Zymoseptoria brevis TaxID=1047168 RepID=A0A0F4GSH1_9PEZI|nr:hypothetical protein TI39_contig340g00008 [Zymoseptoria brevis]